MDGKKIKIAHLINSIDDHIKELSNSENDYNACSIALFRKEFFLNRQFKGTFSSIIWNIIKYLKIAISAKKKNDIIHFNAGLNYFFQYFCKEDFYPFFLNLELYLYSKKAKIFVTYNGCDARQKYKTVWNREISPCHGMECSGGCCNTGVLDIYRSHNLRIFSKYASHIWALTPDILSFLPPSKSSFLPYSVKSSNNIFLPKLGKKLIIAHFYADKTIKGTDYIINAVQHINNKYPNSIDFHLVEEKSDENIIELCKSADLIIDQLLMGWYELLTVKLMLIGKPILTYIDPDNLKFIPSEMKNDLLNTIINADKNNICDVLEHCLINKNFLKEHSQASIRFSAKWHDPKYVASLTTDKYQKALSKNIS